MATWRVTAVNVQEKVVHDHRYNTELGAKTAAELWNNTPKVKAVKINGKIYRKAR